MSDSTLTKVRIGTDITMRARLLDSGVAYDFSASAPVAVRLLNASQNAIIRDLEVSVDPADGTILIVTWRAAGQAWLGQYHLVVSATLDGRTATFDAPAFELVRLLQERQPEAGQPDMGVTDIAVTLEVESIDTALISQILEDCKSATEAANKAASDAKQTDEEIRTAETGRVTAEQERVQAEESRKTAETTREKNEETRTGNESKRQTAEKARQSAEESRKTAETLREAAEQERQKTTSAAVSAAVSAASKAETATETMGKLYDAVLVSEKERVSAEQGRVQAEQSRATAETERASEFTRLKQESETATASANTAAAAANEAAQGIDTKIAGKQDKTDQSLKTTDKTVAGAINEVYDALVLLNRDLEKYDTSISLPMSVEKSGKYVDPDGQEKSSASMGISAPLEIRSGNIYLLQCAAAVGTGVALFSRKVTNTYDKAIAYSYTYNGDGTIATATADYDPELVYSYSYNEEGVATITDKDGETVPELPATHQVTESFYEPLFRTNDATMPKSGYYLLLCTQDMEIVVSAASSDITGKNLLGVRYGVFASIATNFVGSPGQKVIAQAFAELYAAVQALSSVVDNAGHLKADVLDMANLPKVCGEDMYLTGEGAPAAPPTVPFQEYYDSENLKFYKAKGVLPDSPTTGDWVAIN